MWGIVGNLCIFAHYLLADIKNRLKNKFKR